MIKEQFIEVIKNLAFDIFGCENNQTLSKAFIFYALKRFINNDHDCGDEIDNDVLNAITDAPNDRGIDAVYIDDTREDYAIVYIIQGRFINNQTVNEKSISQFVNNFNQFPNINGNKNLALENCIKRYEQLKNDGVDIKKKGIFLTLSNVSTNARVLFQKNDISVYDYEKINAEILTDEFLPDFEINLASIPTFDMQDFLGILDIRKFVLNENIQNYIRSESLFAYNIRGLMNNNGSSIANDIRETCLNNPEKLFRMNNGITIIGESYDNIGDKSFLLKKASVVNGQQTIREIFKISHLLNQNKNYYVSVKVLKLLNKNKEDIKEEILETAKATNRQNRIKESDLKANEYEQINIKEEAKTLVQPLNFNYINKRSYLNSKIVNSVTKEQAALMICSFVNLNPSDRIESLFENNYNKIFKNLKASHIAITNLIKDYIEKRHRQNDENRNGDGFWSKNVYFKFKKQRTINFCLYLLGDILAEQHGYDDVEKRKDLLEQIYNVMKKDNNFNIEDYFSKDLWDVFNIVCARLINKLYYNPKITPDYMRKPLDDKLEFIQIYNDVVYDLAEKNKLDICINL